MFTVELTLKNTALPLSVQKKEVEEAEKLYNAYFGSDSKW
jgi:hypothetical protein